MHDPAEDLDALMRAVVGYARTRVTNGQPLDQPASPSELSGRAGRTITLEGIGAEEALRIWRDVLAPATISTDHPAYLAFVPSAPTKASVLFDLAVSASSVYAGSWLEGAGAVWAENEVLRWIAELAGMPRESGGCFVSGGTAGNLSALVAARHDAGVKRKGGRPRRWRVAAADTAHTSVVSSARVMDAEVLTVPHDERGRLTGVALASILDSNASFSNEVFAVVASAGSTNAGVIDDLEGVAAICKERGLWLHIDGAYGGAALLAPSVRSCLRGLELADSFIVDPHKLLFAPFDACALVYRDPATAKEAHRQEGPYLHSLQSMDDWNPSDYAVHLSRRARGLPLWFSLAVHGVQRYTAAVEQVMRTARDAAAEIARHPKLELVMEPDLSVVIFRRIGWRDLDYEDWWNRVLRAQIGFVQPTTWEGEKVARLCFVNPRTTPEHTHAILGTMT